MAYWIDINNLSQLQPGDVVLTPSKAPENALLFAGQQFPSVQHFGVVVLKDNKLQIAHNPFGGKPVIEPFEKVFADRQITRVMRTNTSNDLILYRFSQCQDNGYQFFLHNCEDFARHLIGNNDAWNDQRGIYMLVTLLIIVFLIIAFSKAQ